VRDVVLGPIIAHYQQRFVAAEQNNERLQQEINRLNSLLADQVSEQKSRIADLRQQSQLSDDQVRAELIRVSRELASNKVDRTRLGQSLMELANQLKGESGN
jgi:hypothetical protein